MTTYYLLSQDFSEQIAGHLASLLPAIDAGVKKYQAEFPEDKDETSVFVEWAIGELGDAYLEIHQAVINEILYLTSEACEGTTLDDDWTLYRYETSTRDALVKKCKSLLSSEINSISPVIEYARIRGNLKAPWLANDIEAVLIDGEGIGHDTKEAAQLDSRHYDHFFEADAILLIEESRKPFVAGGKSALRSIFRRGYGDKLILLFTKLDEVEPYDDEDPTDGDRIEDVRDGLANVLAALKEDGHEIEIEDDRVFFLGGLHGESISEAGSDNIGRIFQKAHEMARFQQSFVAPIYDFEMLSAFLVESTRKFNELYQNMLSAQHWKTVEAFNRRMDMGIDGFRMFTPITDFEEKLFEEMSEFISNPAEWEQEVSETLKKESLNSVRQKFNKLLIDFARREIISAPHDAWRTAYMYSGHGSTFRRRADIEAILRRSVPPSTTADYVRAFKDAIKKLLEQSISSCRTA